METFSHQGRKLAFLQTGHGGPILFLHNAGTSHVIWRHQINALASTHRVIAVDLPGYGQSPLPETSFSLDATTDLIAALLETVAAEEPETVTGLVQRTSG